VKNEEAKEWSQAERIAIHSARLFTGGSLNVHDLVSEFSITMRTAYRDLNILERHLATQRVKCEDSLFRVRLYRDRFVRWTGRYSQSNELRGD